ncbi:MAG: group III truncated hemoglobin [Balneolaceae bacterium]
MSKNDIRNDNDIKILVHTFYGKVQDDERLGFIFNDFARVDWEKHLPNMVDFWSNLLFQTGRYKGRPFRQHIPLPIEKEDFGRWFLLFEETINELFAGEKASYAVEVAGKIASSFTIRMQQMGKFQTDMSSEK